jgi:hypothetical protein
MLLELISESSLFHMYHVGSNLLNITSLCCHQLPKREKLKYLGPYFCVLVINDNRYFWTNIFIEMIIVLVEIRKIFSWRCCLWMTQGNCILIGFLFYRSR